MTSETWRQTASPTSMVLRTFNDDFDAVGRLTEVADSHSLAPDFGFVYDARGQLQLESQQHGLLGQSILFDRNYNAVGNQTLLEANTAGRLSAEQSRAGLWGGLLAGEAAAMAAIAAAPAGTHFTVGKWCFLR